MERRNALFIFLGAGGAAAITAMHASEAMAAGRVTPDIILSLDKADYAPGETMVLECRENLNAGVLRTFEVLPLDADWVQVSDDDSLVTFEAAAAGATGERQVSVKMTRTAGIPGKPWQDGATVTEVLAYTVTEVVDPPPAAGVLIGRSASTNDHGPLTQCDVVRVYKVGGTVDSELAESGATAVFLSDEPGIRSSSALDSALGSLFNQHPDVLVYWMPANEITADQLSSSQAAAYIERTRTDRAVVDQYPNAYMGINLTAYGVRQGRHDNLQPCAQYLDISIASCYNPGRMKSPPVWDPYENYLDQLLDATQEWGVPRFGTGEFGNPVSPSDPNKRPSYAAGAVQYLAAGCEERGLEFTGFCWWDQQKSGGPDNKLSNDNPLTAQALLEALA